ncbi:hypothetical protein [Lachnotalea glycerini]|nr:hypothetical protein [Lachnotalea glycerini]
MMNADSDKFHYVIYASEVVVYDASDNRIVSCPTEDEAVKYIEEQGQEQ